MKKKGGVVNIKTNITNKAVYVRGGGGIHKLF